MASEGNIIEGEPVVDSDGTYVVSGLLAQMAECIDDVITDDMAEELRKAAREISAQRKPRER